MVQLRTYADGLIGGRDLIKSYEMVFRLFEDWVSDRTLVTKIIR